MDLEVQVMTTRDASAIELYCTGADGGNGGMVNIVVQEEDAHLLMLVDHNIDVSGGFGGSPGSNGHGGGGGFPGGGGERHTYWVTGPDGESKSIDVPGGSSGNYGPDGHTPATVLRPGRNGGDGNVTYTLVRENGAQETYRSVYELQLQGFEISTLEEQDDDVLEPGERLVLTNLVVKNVGEMPVPSGQTMLFYLSNADAHFEPIPGEDDTPLKFVGEIAGGMETEIQGQVRCRIKPIEDRDNPLPMADEAKVILVSRLESLPHTFQRFDSLSTTIIVEHPISITKVDMLRSLAPDQQSRVFTSCHHKGKIDVEGRTVHLRLSGSILSDDKTESDLEEKNLLVAKTGEDILALRSEEALESLTTMAKKKQSSDYWDFGRDGKDAPQRDISSIEPGQGIDHTGVVMVGANATPLDRLRLKVSLIMDSYPIDEAKPVQVQAINVDVAVGQEFSSSGGDVVLFLNKDVHMGLFNLVKDTLEKQYKLKVDIYDVSYNGVPDLSGSSGPLSDYTEKKLPVPPVVIFNNPFAIKAGHGSEKVALLDHLSKQGMHSFMHSHSTNFLVLSTEATKLDADQRNELSTPLTPPPKQTAGARSASGIVKALVSDGSAKATLAKPVKVGAVIKAFGKARAYATQVVATVLEDAEGVDDSKQLAKLRTREVSRASNWYDGRIVTAQMKDKETVLRGLADALPVAKRAAALKQASSANGIENQVLLESLRNELIMETLLCAKNAGKKAIGDFLVAKTAIEGLKGASKDVQLEAVLDSVAFAVRQPGICARLYGLKRPSGLQKIGKLVKREASKAWGLSNADINAALRERRRNYGIVGSSDLKKRNTIWTQTVQKSRIEPNIWSTAQIPFLKDADTRGVSCVRAVTPSQIKAWDNLEQSRKEAAIQAGEDMKKDLADFLIEA